MSDENDIVYLDYIPEQLVCPVCGSVSEVNKSVKDVFLLFDRYHLHCSKCNRIRKFIIKE